MDSEKERKKKKKEKGKKKNPPSALRNEYPGNKGKKGEQAQNMFLLG
jgi:hypothetical protein